ncbi:hypothetical protein RHGRI_038908 [Rhododendron griersonianum]|uniref:Uncharacterized protein n=1 Tax=Rhododendron griersonianum TaxID=479676 RepID=A0AAV6HHR5_9ERIC|nr:hypothetical protein RHGRI_038908 [Rhododendron griersonianum]
MEITATEMISRGENDDGEGLQRLTSTIGAKLAEGAQKTKSLISSACIFTVPKDLRKVNQSAYTPRLLAIGPLHRNDKHLSTAMQQVKMSYTDHLLSRLAAGMEGQELEEKKNAVLRECLVEMKKSIVDANNCYLDEVNLDEEMLLVDGCFILELVYRDRTLELEVRKLKASAL